MSVNSAITCGVMLLASVLSWVSHSTSTTLRFVLGAYLLVLFAASAPVLAAGPGGDSSLVAPIDFNIPAQSLGRALIAFGATAGLDFYYNAAFAEGRRSTTVIGKLRPVLALQKLLEGTELAPRMSAPGSVTLVPAAREVVVPRQSIVATSVRYEPYFATIQARVSGALCRNRITNQESDETFLRVWLGTSGVIEQVEVIGSDGDQANNQSLANAVQGLAIGSPPPDMPQPVMLVVFPPSAGRHDCRSSNASQKAN
jgi:hypothetical protein